MLGQVLGAIPYSCTLFEPLHIGHVPEAGKAGFSSRKYVDPESDWPEGERFLRRVFEGRVANAWTTREMTFRDASSARRLVVKCVRANRLLPWICRRFSVPRPVLLLRHPCAVVASQLKFGINLERRPAAPGYIRHFPAFRAAVAEATSDEQRYAATWALDQLPALLHDGPPPWMLVTYEELVLRPEETLSTIARRWGVTIDIDNALSRLRKPSSTVSRTGIKGVDGWKSELSKRQMSSILNTVNALGISFYSRDDEADYETLHSDELARSIREAAGN
jgi:hypothetical protein